MAGRNIAAQGGENASLFLAFLRPRSAPLCQPAPACFGLMASVGDAKLFNRLATPGRPGSHPWSGACGHDSQPQDGFVYGDDGEGAASGFLAAGCDASGLLDLGEPAFDQMALSEEAPVERVVASARRVVGDARMMVVSTIRYAKSGSSDIAAKTRRHTPCRLQRLKRRTSRSNHRRCRAVDPLRSGRPKTSGAIRSQAASINTKRSMTLNAASPKEALDQLANASGIQRVQTT